MTDVNALIAAEVPAGPERLTTAVDKEIQYFDLDAVDFDRKWNIRRVDKYDERIQRKVQELLTDGVIRTPLGVGLMINEGNALRGMTGFLRHGALCEIRKNHPEAWAECFEGRVPFLVTVCQNEAERERLMLDHGSEEELDEYEVFDSIVRYTKRGMGQFDVAVLLNPMLFRLANAANRRILMTRLAELKEKGFVGKATTEREVIGNFWRKRVQNYLRLYKAGKDGVGRELVLSEFRRAVDGKRSSIPESVILRLAECETEEQVRELLTPKDMGGAGVAKGIPRPRLLTFRDICKSKLLVEVIDVMLGNLPPEKLAEIEEDLVGLGL